MTWFGGTRWKASRGVAPDRDPRVAQPTSIHTKNGRRAALLISADDFDSIMETLEILGDREAMEAIREADADIAAGRVYPLDEVEAELRAKGTIT
ncbi:type II toxin-antitoxin system Phd/YefM family antitoxin [Mycolicibacter longobardus]|uniref:type II toxin-antitoxin system Phd/YefM family antitoxin n=1 Tax=Mycolicibacter longobardus TaxID=1108812 RepID=UPI001F45C1A7|nr:type II toxin-antitoxin system prevent-host-death family antitoxin [Mycolicibacter longobardus]